MIDEGEADWKVVAIDREDPWAEKLHDIEDVKRMVPGMLDAIREWFRTYKIPDGKPPNTFALGERFLNRSYALCVVHETHRAWAKLVRGAVEEEEDKGDVRDTLSAQAPVATTATSTPPGEQEQLATGATPAPPTSGLKKSTLKRNLSVPSLEALNHVEHSLLMDETALHGALLAAKGHTDSDN